jgi:hypothetical protein
MPRKSQYSQKGWKGISSALKRVCNKKQKNAYTILRQLVSKSSISNILPEAARMQA